MPENINVIIYIAFLILMPMLGIIVLNFKNPKFSLPEKIIILFFIFQNLRKEEKFFGVREAFLFNLFFTIGYYLLTILTVKSFFNFEFILFSYESLIILVISILISIYLYSEMTENIIKRSMRQAVLWSFLFIILFVFVMFQFRLIFSKNNLNNYQTLINVVLLLFTLIFNLATISEKLRIFFSEYYNSVEIKLKRYISYLHHKFSCTNEINNLREIFIKVKYYWNNGKKKEIIILIIIIVLIILFYFHLIKSFINPNMIDGV